MIAYPYGALITGLMLVASGVLTLVRHFLFEPFCEHYPRAPLFVRHGMFMFGTVLCFLGLQFLWVFFADKPDTIPPQPGPALQLLSVALMIYKSIMLANTLGQKHMVVPDDIKRRIQNLYTHHVGRDSDLDDLVIALDKD